MSRNDLIIAGLAALVIVGAAWYAKKKIGAAVDAVGETIGEAWIAAAEYADGAWQAGAPALDQSIADMTGVPSVYTPGMNYPDYLAAANTRRDTVAAQYGPQIVNGRPVATNPINDAFTGLYQSVMGPGRTLGSDIYDWTH